MKDDEIDRILSHEDDISPSSGFVASVMEFARAEAATPPPIPFPWARALPGLVAGVAALTTLAVAIVRGWWAAAPSSSMATDSLPMLASLAASPEVIWILAASLLAFAAVRVSLRLADGY